MRRAVWLAVALLALIAPSAYADTIVVNTGGTIDDADATNGSGPCEAEPENGNCTLRAAIQTANVNPGKDTITFDLDRVLARIKPTPGAAGHHRGRGDRRLVGAPRQPRDRHARGGDRRCERADPRPGQPRRLDPRHAPVRAGCPRAELGDPRARDPRLPERPARPDGRGLHARAGQLPRPGLARQGHDGAGDRRALRPEHDPGDDRRRDGRDPQHDQRQLERRAASPAPARSRTSSTATTSAATRPAWP